MRKPKLFMDFDLKNDIGLSSFLSGGVEFDKIIQKTKYPNLDLISGGPVPPNPAELMLSPLMADLISKAKENYEKQSKTKALAKWAKPRRGS